jgi:hypothetical protein
MSSRAFGAVGAVLVIGALLAGPSTASAQNLLVNPSFEETVDWGEGPKPAGWGVWGTTWSIDALDANATLPPLDGERMELNMGPWWCPWCNSGFVQDLPAASGQLWQITSSSYATSAFSMAGTQNFMVMKIEFWDHFDPHPEWGELPLAQPEVVIADGATPLDEWQSHALQASAPAGTVMARAAFVWIQPNWEEGAAIVDDASMGLLLDLDIKPGSCPNSFNRGSHGVLPVGLLAGMPGFDITTVDAGSILLSRADGIGGAVAPHEGPPGPHSEFEDVGTPFHGEWCECHEEEGDGLTDLSLKFKTDDVVDALELDDLPMGEWVELVLSGALLDGTPFEVSDCIRLVPPGGGAAAIAVGATIPNGWISVSPLDQTLDGGGFTNFKRRYPVGTSVTLTAPEFAGGRAFGGWVIDGVPNTTGTTGGFIEPTPNGNRTIELILTAGAHRLEATYATPGFTEVKRLAPRGQ